MAKNGKKKKPGTPHQLAKGAAATESHPVQQFGAPGPRHAEVMAAPRARLPVVVTKGFLLLLWRSLQHLGRLIRFVLTRRNTGVLHPPAPPPSNAPGGVDPAAALRVNAAGGVDHVRWLARCNAFNALHRRHPAAAATLERSQAWAPPSPSPSEVQPQPPPPPPPPPPPGAFQLVDGKLVPNEELSMYVEYCKTRSNLRKMLVCHMCIFTDYRYYRYTFKASDMLLHCWKIHGTPGLECKYGGYRVRVTTHLELRRHMHFCHSIPIDWWKHYKQT